jgi:two-component system LytT family response regulator
MMDTEEKYKVVIIDDERSASDALRRELEPYREFEILQAVVQKGKR